MADVQDILAGNVKALRGGLSQPAFAKKCAIGVGVIRNIEQKKKWVGLKVLRKIASACGCETSDLFDPKAPAMAINRDHGLGVCVLKLAQAAKLTRPGESFDDLAAALREHFVLEAFSEALPGSGGAEPPQAPSRKEKAPRG